MPRGLGVALSECIWYSLGSICEDALEFEQDPEGNGELMKDLKGRPATKIRSVFEKDHSGCILEDGNSGGGKKKKTSERGLVQMSSHVGYGGARRVGGFDIQKVE